MTWCRETPARAPRRCAGRRRRRPAPRRNRTRTHRSAVSARPHHRHTAPAVSRSGSDIGPVQCLQRAMVRHFAHASAGTYPRRGTCTSTGRSGLQRGSGGSARPSTAAGRCARRGRVPGRSRCPRARSPAVPWPAPPDGSPPDRAPSRCAPAPAPRRCGRSRRSTPRSAADARAASPPRGRADTAPAARRGCRRRRPRRSPDRGRRPARRRRCGCRSTSRACPAQRRTASGGTAAAGPRPADSATTRASSTCRTAAACSASTSRWSGTMVSAARPEFTTTAAASASRSVHDSPGNACHTARAARPSASAPRNCSPRAVRRPGRRVDGRGRQRWKLGHGLLLDAWRGAAERPAAARRRGCPHSARRPRRRAAHVRRQHRLGGDHPVEPAELADMVGLRTSFEHEGVDEPAVEPHPDPHAGLGVIGLIGSRPGSRTRDRGAAPTASAAPERSARARRPAASWSRRRCSRVVRRHVAPDRRRTRR